MQSVVMLVAGNERGGAASHLAILAEANMSHPTNLAFLFVCMGRGPLHAGLVSIGANVRLLDGRMWANLTQLVGILRTIPEVILHAHGPRMNVLASIAAKRAKCPWTSTIHSNPNLDFLSSKFKTMVFPTFHRWRLATAVGFFVGNPTFANELPEKPIVFVPNAIRLPKLPQEKAFYQTELRRKLQLNKSAKVIGIAARLDPVKDIPTLLRAMTRVTDASVHLAIAGDGLERSALIAYAKQLGLQERVHLLGFIEDIRSFYAGLEIHVLPSLSEGASPFCLLEAGSVGVLNIGSAIPGVLNLLHDGITGSCFEVGNDRQLADQINYFLNHPEEAAREAEEFKRVILPNFEPTKMVEAYSRGYQTFKSLP